MQERTGRGQGSYSVGWGHLEGLPDQVLFEQRPGGSEEQSLTSTEEEPSWWREQQELGLLGGQAAGLLKCQ